MKTIRKMYFLGGFIFAVLCVAVLAGNDLFPSLMASNSVGNLPRELRLGVELGLIQENQIHSSRALRRNVTSGEFAEKTALMLSLIGHPFPTADYLSKHSIIDCSQRSRVLYKAEAAEALARLCIDLKKIFPLKEATVAANDYTDYSVPEEYKKAFAYMQSRFVINGTGGGVLGASRKLTLREAVYLLYRLYETVSSDKIKADSTSALAFIDLVNGHPVLPTIQNLYAHGAFDNMILRPAFDGNAFITKIDAVDMFTGVAARGGVNLDPAFINGIFSGKTDRDFVSRAEIARLTDYLITQMCPNKVKEAEVRYKDLDPEDPTTASLKKIAGSCCIILGYGNGTFKGHEMISLYEASNILNNAVKFLSENSSEGFEKAAESDYDTVFDSGSEFEQPSSSEIESYIALLKQKRDKIRQILGHGARPSGHVY